ncbi:mechanosensitive ion channel family protein [Methylophaga sp.]|uniref:mechanosensitive ion channel family protein n=1 Tax=Methylophaga sp. TaxID=2024840 RepID=UPI003F69ABFC
MSIPEWLPNLSTWSIIVLLVFSVFISLELIKRIILRHMIKVTQKKDFFLTSVILKAVKFPLTLFFLAFSVKLFEQLILHYGVEINSTIFNTIAQLVLIVAIVMLIDRLISSFVGRYADKNISFKSSKGIMQGLTHIMVLGIGLLIILSTIGISITPVIASLGITSLALALALQPTLENFFSGIQLVIDKPIRVGDFIELDSAEQGFVVKIGWRTTWIRMLPNNVVIIPNSVLSKSKLINYYYPEKELSVPVDVGVHYNSDLEHVERVTLEVAREILKSHKWGVSDYQTFVVFHTFDNSSINFTVMLRAQEYFNRFFIKSAFIKALHKRYAEEGITIPYPIRAINYDQESAHKASSITSVDD